MKINIRKLIIDSSCFEPTKKYKRKKPKFIFNALYRINNQTILMEDIKMVILTDTQKVSLSVNPVSAKGNVALLDEAPVWEVSDPAVLSLLVAEDGLSATVFAVGPVGIAQVVVRGDADLGEGVTEIVGTLDVEVVAGSAASFAIVTGVPEENV